MIETTIAQQIEQINARITRLHKRIDYLRFRNSTTPHTDGDLADLDMLDWLLDLAERERVRITTES